MRRMVAEKIAAFAEALLLPTAAIKGGSSNHVTKRVLSVYKKRAHPNRPTINEIEFNMMLSAMENHQVWQQLRIGA
jgi:hypothetical protein